MSTFFRSPTRTVVAYVASLPFAMAVGGSLGAGNDVDGWIGHAVIHGLTALSSALFVTAVLRWWPRNRTPDRVIAVVGASVLGVTQAIEAYGAYPLARGEATLHDTLANTGPYVMALLLAAGILAVVRLGVRRWRARTAVGPARA